MKYIRGQDGGIYSVAQLKPPCKEHPEGEAVWKLRVVTVAGSSHSYATYSTEAAAVLTYKQVTEFMDGAGMMLEFTLGANGICHKPSEAFVVQMPDTRVEFQVPIVARPWLSIPASAVTPWWRKLWPWRRKGESE